MNKYAELMRRSAEEHKAAFAESDLTRELRAAADEIEKAKPVAAQHRFRHPQKTMPNWSVWQPAAIDLRRPRRGVDSMGYEVEYRLLYDAPVAPDTEQLRTTLTDALNWYERQAQVSGDFTMVERMKKALGI